MSKVISIIQGPAGRVCLLDKDRAAGPHAHPDPHVMLQIEGAAHEYEVGGAAVPLDRRHAVLVNRSELHGNRAVGTGRSIVLMLYLSTDWASHRHASLPGTPFFDSPSADIGPALRMQADQLAARMREAGDINDPTALALLDSLVHGLCAAHGPAAARRRQVDKLNDFRIRRAIALMREHIEEPLSAAQLCARVGLSRSRFFELFAACTGLSPKHYGNMLRLELATERLARHDEPIAEVSQKCGFGAQSHFSKFFVEQQGFTPREFRRAAAPVMRH